MKLLSSALLLCGATAAIAIGLPEADGGVTLSLDKDLYPPYQHAFLTVSGPPGTIVVLGFDFDPGPTTLPGIGTVDLGLSDKFLYLTLPPIPAEGTKTFEWKCYKPCESPLLGNNLYIQGVTIDPVTFELGLTNSVELNIEDIEGSCEGVAGCTPGYWKNHPESWGPTGLAPEDSWNETFGVVGYDPDVTLIEAADPPTELMTFGAHAVAALLNALHPDSGYAISADAVIDLVQAAVNSGDPAEIDNAKNLFANLNEKGCLLN